ncbi:hypothetical protein [Benzoatithermus flavus]|uniref:Uncharacterized protein n=1 Tax=Benzoatithermus flavus TaxID=3108223 RepID=A0ABU8XRV6_9PROT
MMSAHRLRRAAPFVFASAAAFLPAGTVAGAGPDEQALIEDALSAAPPAIRETAKVMDENGTVLREGSGPYVCMPTPASLRSLGKEAMCADAVWMAWNEAYMARKPFKTDRIGIAYMLSGDTGASNVDPYATGPTADNQFVVEGPHVMILVPDPAQLEAIPATPQTAGPYVMWKGTPYAHIMVPVGKRPAQRTAGQ